MQQKMGGAVSAFFPNTRVTPVGGLEFNRPVMFRCRYMRPLRVRCVAAVVLLSLIYLMYVYMPVYSIKGEVGRQNWVAVWRTTSLYNYSIESRDASTIYDYSNATGDSSNANVSTAATTIESHIQSQSLPSAASITGTSLVHKDEEGPTAYSLQPQDFHVAPRNSTFSFSKDFSFPHPSAFKSVHSIQNWSWVKALQEFLISIHPGRTVTLTVASKDYMKNLLNWLISAQVIAEPSLQNVLVISFDKSLHELLTQREISSIFVPPEAVLKNSKGLSRVWMTRMAVIRLINHWGFDVQQFDTDAIILRNPELLYRQFPDSDVIGSRGMLPFDIGKKMWGFTVCMGAILFRSTPKTELLWKSISRLRMNTMDDQYRINYALLDLNIKWSTTGKSKPDIRANITGIDSNGLKVAILPPIYICRGLCKAHGGENIDFYVWHEAGGGHSAKTKLKKDAHSKVWFLRNDWNNVVTKLTGRKWLEALMERRN